MNAFVASVAAECPQALAGAPVNAKPDEAEEGTQGFTDQELLMLTGLQGLEIAQRSADAAAVQQFAATLQRLHWHSRQLTNLVHTFGQIETERAQKHTPNLCGQIKAWTASGYKTLPPEALEEPPSPSTHTLAHELAALGCGLLDSPEHAVVALLRHYQRAGEQPTTRQVELAEFHWEVAAIQGSDTAAIALEHALDAHFPPKRLKKPHTSKTKSKLPRPYAACSGRPEPSFSRL